MEKLKPKLFSVMKSYTKEQFGLGHGDRRTPEAGRSAGIPTHRISTATNRDRRIAVATIDSVSYTHLDVYKRQTVTRPPTTRTTSPGSIRSRPMSATPTVMPTTGATSIRCV